MKEKTVQRGQEKVVEVRSDAGKLLFIKTKAGYEFKCPRSKQICLISYQNMLSDCMKCVDDGEVPLTDGELEDIKKNILKA